MQDRPARLFLPETPTVLVDPVAVPLEPVERVRYAPVVLNGGGGVPGRFWTGTG